MFLYILENLWISKYFSMSTGVLALPEHRCEGRSCSSAASHVDSKLGYTSEGHHNAASLGAGRGDFKSKASAPTSTMSK